MAVKRVMVFTKTDKLSKRQLSLNIEKYQKKLSEQWEELPLSILSSAKTGTGKEEILTYISETLAPNN